MSGMNKSTTIIGMSGSSCETLKAQAMAMWRFCVVFFFLIYISKLAVEKLGRQ
jgi:hypothetical protein